MAEFVEFRAEEMVPELEQLKRLRIFSEAEIRTVIKNRKNFQYKIQRRTKCIDDYMRYIKYEKDLMMMVKSRRKKMGITQKESEIDMTIAHRINKLFKQAIFQFRDDIHLWLSYMKFCKQVKVFSVCVSYMLGDMLAMHSHKPSLWKLAATWEFEENKSIENACQFLLRGLRHHPDSKILYMEAFRLELIYAYMKRKQLETKESAGTQEGKQAAPPAPPGVPLTPADAPLAPVHHTNPVEVDRGDGSVGHPSQGHSSQTMLPRQEVDPALMSHNAIRSDDISDPVVDCRPAEFIYESACEKIHDVTFLISLLDIAKDFSFTEKLQAKMVKDLLSRFPNDERTWDALARRELEGLHFLSDRTSAEDIPEYRESMEVSEENEPKTGPSMKSEIERVQYLRIKRCFTIYQQGLRHLNSERMRSLYLSTLIEINQDLSVLKKCKRKLLCSAFKRAHEKGQLQEKYYIHWAAVHSGQREELCYVLSVATERFPGSVDLWQMRLSFHLSEGEEQIAMAVFKRAIACLRRDDAATLPLWKMLIQYFQTKSVVKVEAIFREGIMQGPAVSSVLKQMFLEWLVLTKDINTARQAYQAMCDQPPFCREMHQKMATLECLQPEVELPLIIKCYELACEQFGKNNTDVWMEYVKFERRRGDPNKVKDVYNRALNVLDEELAHHFKSEFLEYWVVKTW